MGAAGVAADPVIIVGNVPPIVGLTVVSIVALSIATSATNIPTATAVATATGMIVPRGMITVAMEKIRGKWTFAKPMTVTKGSESMAGPTVVVATETIWRGAQTGPTIGTQDVLHMKNPPVMRIGSHAVFGHYMRALWECVIKLQL